MPIEDILQERRNDYDVTNTVQVSSPDAVLAASIFHYGEYTVRQAKEVMAARGIEVRL